MFAQFDRVHEAGLGCLFLGLGLMQLLVFAESSHRPQRATAPIGYVHRVSRQTDHLANTITGKVAVICRA